LKLPAPSSQLTAGNTGSSWPIPRRYSASLAARRASSPAATGHRRATSANQGVISSIEARRTLLYRSDHFKQKLIAANVTQVIVVVATEPAFSDELITRCIVAAESQDIKVLIVLNKCDLSERVAAARRRWRNTKSSVTGS
jgi:putative ribosome biogenesis GTPase RsgA